MAIIESAIHLVYLGLSLLGIAVVAVGVVEAILGYVRLQLFRVNDATFLENAPKVRMRLGEHLVLALDFFIAADIVNSVIAPSLETVVVLAVIVLIRVVLAWILLREIEAARAETHPSARLIRDRLGRLQGEQEDRREP